MSSHRRLRHRSRREQQAQDQERILATWERAEAAREALPPVRLRSLSELGRFRQQDRDEAKRR